MHYTGDIFRDVDSGTEDELPTHRHNITSASYTPYSHLTAMPNTHTTTNNNSCSSGSGVNRQPSTPPGKTSAVHRLHTAGQGYGESQSLLLGKFTLFVDFVWFICVLVVSLSVLNLYMLLSQFSCTHNIFKYSPHIYYVCTHLYLLIHTNTYYIPYTLYF